MKIVQSCPALCDTMIPRDCTVHGFLQARILDRVAFPFSRASSQPRNRTQVSCMAGGFLTCWATGEAHCGSWARDGSVNRVAERVGSEWLQRTGEEFLKGGVIKSLNLLMAVVVTWPYTWQSKLTGLSTETGEFSCKWCLLRPDFWNGKTGTSLAVLPIQGVWVGFPLRKLRS